MARMLGGVRIFSQPNGTSGQGWQGALEVHLEVWTLSFLVVDKMMVEEGLRNAQSVKISQIKSDKVQRKCQLGRDNAPIHCGSSLRLQ